MLFTVAARRCSRSAPPPTLEPHARGLASSISGTLPSKSEHLCRKIEKGVALLLLREQYAQLVINPQSVLYLTRRIELHNARL